MTTKINTPLIRFITAGSVDDGKSTLIGRLLYDSKALLTDQLKTLELNSTDGALDFSTLTDGLAAEKEQGITIDVAYRYFNTANSKFIIADAPGHEEYTRNMVTGASTADVAIILIDISKLNFAAGQLQLLEQTKRHSSLLKILNCPNIIVAINKLDLLNYNQQQYQQTVELYQLLADKLQLHVKYIPISALYGTNIIESSQQTPWYSGPPLIKLLEEVQLASDSDPSPTELYFPVQYVQRQDGSQRNDFRGYLGRVELGKISVGQKIKLAGSTKTSTIAKIIKNNQFIQQAVGGENICLTLEDEIAISRGDILLDQQANLISHKKFSAYLCWLNETALNMRRKYLLKFTSKTLPCFITNIEYVLDIKDLMHRSTVHQLQLNDIGKVNLLTQQAVSLNDYYLAGNSGAFILIDEVTNDTVAAGCITSNSSLDPIFTS